MGYLLLFGTGMLAIVFGASSWSKVRSPSARLAFVRSVSTWGLLPDRFAGRAAAALSGSELVAAVLLCVSVVVTVAGLDRRRMIAMAGLAVSALLLITLTMGLVVLLRRGVTGRCACFGSSETPLRRLHVVRNSLLVVVAVLGLAAAVSTAPVSAAGVVVALGLAAAAALLVIRLDDIVDLFAPPPATSPSKPPSLVSRS